MAVTAVAGNALDAEILAKAALLSGPQGARRLLQLRGGVLQHDDGRVEIRAGAAPRAAAAPAAHEATDPFHHLFWLASRSAGIVACARCCSALDASSGSRWRRRWRRAR